MRTTATSLISRSRPASSLRRLLGSKPIFRFNELAKVTSCCQILADASARKPVATFAFSQSLLILRMQLQWSGLVRIRLRFDNSRQRSLVARDVRSRSRSNSWSESRSNHPKPYKPHRSILGIDAIVDCDGANKLLN